MRISDWSSDVCSSDLLPSLYGKVTAPTPTAPLWTQDQAIAYEAALEAINDVIAGYSEQIALEHGRVVPNTARIAWLEMRTDQESATGHAPNVMDDENVRQTLLEYRSEEHTSELQSLMRISHAVFCLNTKQ